MPRAAWPEYRTVRELVHRHAGRPAVVMGGGESLNPALPLCPTDAVYICVNDHGLRSLKDRPHLARRCDYVVACDKIEDRARFDVGLPGMKRDGAPWNVPVISRQMWADYRLLFMPQPGSGFAAAWLARVMGCAPVILTGMDLYAGGAYHDAPKAKTTGRVITDRQHMKRWRILMARYPYQYRTIGCHPLLARECGQYDAREPACPPIPRDKLQSEAGGVWCRTTKQTMIGMRTFAAGVALELGSTEAENLAKKNDVRRIASGEIPQ